MSQASMLFVENCGPYIIRRNLCRNFLLHLVNLHDFNLVTTATIDRAMARMKEIEESLPELEEGQELSDATCNGHAVSSGVSLHGKRTKSGVSDWQQLVLQDKLWTRWTRSSLNSNSPYLSHGIINLNQQYLWLRTIVLFLICPYTHLLKRSPFETWGTSCWYYRLKCCWLNWCNLSTFSSVVCHTYEQYHFSSHV